LNEIFTSKERCHHEYFSLIKAKEDLIYKRIRWRDLLGPLYKKAFLVACGKRMFDKACKEFR
jgi:hypothetical protein